MSISPIGTRVPTLSPNSIIRAGIPLQDNFNATDVAVTVESLLVASGRFDVTFTGLEFRSIGVAPLLLIQSSRTIIITSAAIIITEQTEAFDFTAGITLITTDINKPQATATDILLNVNVKSLMPPLVDVFNNIGQGNAYVASKSGEDATTGDGFVRILGTYYEIDL
jgi:hypothetical protein